jgi:hypothetical protein
VTARSAPAWSNRRTPARDERTPPRRNATGIGDASSAEITEPSAGADIVALDEETAERLLAGDLHPAQAPPGYAGVAVLLAAAAATPSPDELAGQAAALGELDTMARARRL